MKPTQLASIVVLLGMCGQAAAHGDEDHSRAAAPVAPTSSPIAAALGSTTEFTAGQRLADGSLFIPKAMQRQLGLRTVLTTIKELPVTVEFNGKMIADPNAGGRVQAGQSGRIEAGPRGLPTLGQNVVKGQILSWLRPIASSIERGNSQAQLAELEAQLAIAERKVERYAQLDGAVPQAAIDASRFELAALKKRRAVVSASVNAAEALVAPASGIISVSNVVLGQVVDTKEILFEVVDPTRLAVEALAYDPALTTDIASASAIVSGTVLGLQFVGGGKQLREQAIVLLFRVKSIGEESLTASSAALAVGQTLKVIAKTTRTIKGAAVPQSALVKLGAGQTAVWVHTEAERFVLRTVKSQAIDARTVSLTSGVASGERVVAEGASFLTQVR